GRHAADEQVRVERRRRDHAQDVAVADIHDDTAAGFLAEDFEGAVLDVGVEGENDILARDRRTGAADVLGDDATTGVHLDPIAAGLAAQVEIESLLHALPPDPEPRIVEQLGDLLAALPN